MQKRFNITKSQNGNFKFSISSEDARILEEITFKYKEIAQLCVFPGRYSEKQIYEFLLNFYLNLSDARIFGESAFCSFENNTMEFFLNEDDKRLFEHILRHKEEIPEFICKKCVYDNLQVSDFIGQLYAESWFNF